MFSNQYTGVSNNRMYIVIPIFLERVCLIALSLFFFVGVSNGSEEQPRNQQYNQEVDQRECGRTPQVELPYCHGCERLAQKGCRAPRATSCENKGLDIDHEAVHKPQKHSNDQYALKTRQLDVAEYCPLRSTVDFSCLIKGLGNGAQAGIAE